MVDRLLLYRFAKLRNAMSIGPSLVYYRVVGTCSDNSKMIICNGLMEEHADRVKKSLLGSRAFASIEIEPDEQSLPSLDLKPFMPPT